MGHLNHRTFSSSSSESSSSDSGGENETTRTPIVVAAKPKPEKSKKRHAKLLSNSASDSESVSSSEHQRKKLKSGSKHRSSTGETEASPSKKSKTNRALKYENSTEDHVTSHMSEVASALNDLTPTIRDETKEPVDRKNTEVSTEVTATLFAEVICEFADFATSLAQKISLKTGYEWTPKILRGAGKHKDNKVREPKDPNEPRRPLSSYALWMVHIRKKIKEQQPDRPPLKMQELAEIWKKTSPEQKAIWEQASKVERDQYNKVLEAYNRTKAQTINEINGKP